MVANKSTMPSTFSCSRTEPRMQNVAERPILELCVWRGEIWDLNIPSERATSKLSENHKIVEFGHQNSSYRANSSNSQNTKA